MANKDKVVAGELTLERVLADKELFASFSRFMQSIHADECLEFYKVVSHEYKTLDFSNQSPENVAKIKGESCAFHCPSGISLNLLIIDVYRCSIKNCEYFHID